jgi:hypothetical protein
LYFLLLWNDTADGLAKDNFPHRFHAAMQIYQEHAPTIIPTEKRLLAPALAIKAIMTATVRLQLKINKLSCTIILKLFVVLTYFYAMTGRG